MSRPADPAELPGLRGVLECRRSAGAIAVQLRGMQREAEGVSELLFAGVTEPLPVLPAQLHAARVLRTPAGVRIEAREGCFELHARSVQLHRETAAAFFRAVPSAPVRPMVRLGWMLLLSMLRLPGMAALLRRR